MKNMLRLSALLLFALLACSPASAGCLTLLFAGKCSASGPPPIVTPSILPMAGSFFNQGSANGTVNNALKPNGGMVGAFQFPTTTTNSMVFYGEFEVNPALNFSNGGSEYAMGEGIGSVGLSLGANGASAPYWSVQRNLGGAVPGSNWWNATSIDAIATTGAWASVAGSSGFNTGYFPFTFTGGNCTREPSGVWFGTAAGFKVSDVGFNCDYTPTLTSTNLAEVAGAGAKQNTGTAASPPLVATTCTPASPSATQVTITAHVNFAHGLSPGKTFALGGFPTLFSTTYTALNGTAGTTLVGTATINGGSCTTPVNFTGEGTAGSGVLTSFTPLTVPLAATNPFRDGPTGILSRSGQHVCGIVGEYGDDSNFPGAAFASFVDADGNALTGAPAVVPNLNQANAFFTGSLTVGQPSLNVSAMTSFSITSASYVPASGSVPAKAQFVFGAAPQFIAGTEFTVSGMTPAGYNQTYVADGATTQAGATVTGIPLTGPRGTPLASFTSLAAAGTGAAVTIIMPGMNVFGAASGSVISPFTAAQTGGGGVGTYQLSATQTAVGSASMFTYPAHYYSAVSSGVLTHRTVATLGDFFAIFGSTVTTTTTGSHLGWGGAMGNISMLYGAFPMSSVGVPDTTQIAALCKKSQTVQGFAAAQTAAGNTMSVHSLYELNDPGMWGDSGQGDFTGTIVAGSPAVLTITSASPPTLATGAVISGPGIAGCPLTCPTVTTGGAGPYNLTASVTQVNIGPIAMKAGTYKPATPLSTASVNGYIDSVSGTPTLHVVSPVTSTVATGFSAQLGSVVTGHVDNGTISTAGDLLTVTVPGVPGSGGTYAFLTIGSTIQGGSLSSPVTIIAMSPTVSSSSSTACDGSPCTGTGWAGTYQVSSAAQTSGASAGLFASGVLPSPARQIGIIGTPTGTVLANSLITDGGVNITGNPVFLLAASTAVAGFSSTFSVLQPYYPTNITYTSLQDTVTTIIPGQYLAGGTRVALPFPVRVIGYGPNFKASNGLTGDDYTLSNSSNGNVGTIGSPVVINTTGISDGGVIAPGPALTIKDLGAGVTFPITSASCSAYATCTGGGPVTVSGTYDTAALGGTPAAIQAQISLTPGGAPVPGCSACAWTNLSGYSATLSLGTVFNWTGQALNISPAGGLPIFVSVRASNGTAYVTMPSYIKMAISADTQGEGQVGAFLGSASGDIVSYYKGLWGYNNWSGIQLDQGPPVAFQYQPGLSVAIAGDRFSIQQPNSGAGVFWAEGVSVYEQKLSDAFGGWASFMTNNTRDGIGSTPKTVDGIAQTQTVALGDGTTLAWCSAATFCPNVSVAGPLYFSAGVQTGATIVNATLNTSGVLVIPVGNQASGAPNTTGLTTGALEPGFVLSGTGSTSVTGTPTLSYCVSGCTFAAYVQTAGFTPSPTQTWQVTCTGACPTITSPSTMRADPASGPAPMPANNLQFGGLTQLTSFLNGGFSSQLIQAGTFQVLKNGTAICSDTSSFAYNVQGGTCTGTNVSAWVNYATGDYQVTFASGHAPLSTDVITATWVNLISPDGNGTTVTTRPVGFGFFGNGNPQSGPMSSTAAKTPGGLSFHIGGGDINDDAQLTKIGYVLAAPGFSQTLAWLYHVRFPALLPGQSSTTPVFTNSAWRGEGPIDFNSGGSGAQAQSGALAYQWGQDFATKSQFSGSIASGVLILSGAATGPMWEGEVIDCVSVAGGCTAGASSGIYIASLASGTWGAAGSTYNLTGAGSTASTGAMQNAVYDPLGTAQYMGPINDIPMQEATLSGTTGYAPHMGAGSFAGRRIGARLAAQAWGGLTSTANASDATLDRTKASATGCDLAALANPCFDIGNTFEAAHSATMVSSSATITVTGGISPNDRPFVVGQLLSCTSCTAGRFITSIDVPPSQSTTAGAGEVGQTFHITANGTMGVSATETLKAGCSGTSGTGSNCIDIAFEAGTTNGTFGTAWALATCGENNLNGPSPNYVIPSGVCQNNGIGSLVRTFRIGTSQPMWGLPGVATPGSPYDDGADPNATGAFNQSAAFTCNIVAAKVVQCVKGANYDTTTHLLTGIGSWLSSPGTFVAYGDSILSTSRVGSVQGSVGGQPFAFTPGSGGTNGTAIVTATGCTTAGGSAVIPKLDITISGGAIVNVYPSSTTVTQAMGIGIAGGCTWTPTSGTGKVSALVTTPPDGAGGYATVSSDQNMMGDMLYGNEGIPGNPLNPFFTDSMGGYWEPGLPVQPWGSFAGAQVSG
jgi:hypothetical protein